MAIDKRKIPTDLQSGVLSTIKEYFPPTNLFSFFPLFQGVVENTYSAVLQTVRLIRDFFADYDQDNSVRYEWRLPHNLVFIFQMENVSPGKKKKRGYLRHLSTGFHQVFTKMIAPSLVI